MTTRSWRRNTDSPGMWIAVFSGSISLHLLALFLMHSYGLTVASMKHSSRVIPIEVVKVPTVAKSSTAKPVSPKQPSTSVPKPKVAPDPNAAVKPTIEPNLDADASDAIASGDNQKASSPSDRLTNNSQPQKQDSQKKTSQEKKVEAKPPVVPYDINSGSTIEQPKPTPQETKPIPTPPVVEKPIPTPQPIPSIGKKPTPTPQPIPPVSPEPIPTPQPIPPVSPEPIPTPQPIPPVSPEPIPTPKPTSPPPPFDGDNPEKSVSVVTWSALPTEEAIQYINDIPDNLAAPIGSTQNNLDPDILASYPSLQPAEILASLVINNQGKFIEAGVIEIKTIAAKTDRSTYKQFVNDYFSQQRFIPARNNDGTQPELSNLIVEVKIQR
ncbi:MAG: hypothetical protein QNJ47_19385 [Nostocaceae cyanobacterium]|nr:hypothetical protein [Nostocaceae cyanobacterium]